MSRCGKDSFALPTDGVMQLDHVIVLSPSKTGSAGVLRVLKSALGVHNVRHAHLISEAALTSLRAKNHPDAEKWLESARAISNGTVGLVTLVREPVARLMSAYVYYRKRVDRPSTVPFDIYIRKQARVQKSWFGTELGALGLSLFNGPSPAKTGFAIQHSGRFTFVVIRLEDLDRCGAKALSVLTDRPLSIQRFNASDRALKSELLAKHAIPEAMIDMLYDLPETRFCYTAAELNSYREYWRGLWSSGSNAPERSAARAV